MLPRLCLCALTLIWHPNHSIIKTFHYFYFTQPVFVSVACPNHAEYREITGHLALFIACYLRSAQLSTFPSKLYHGFTANISNYIIPLETLKNLNMSSIKYATNTLSEFKISNNSDLGTVVRESLPLYLTHVVHFPSIIAPVFLIIIIVFPLIYLVRKALTLYYHLNRIVMVDAENAHHG